MLYHYIYISVLFHQVAQYIKFEMPVLQSFITKLKEEEDREVQKLRRRYKIIIIVVINISILVYNLLHLMSQSRHSSAVMSLHKLYSILADTDLYSFSLCMCVLVLVGIRTCGV